MSSRLRTFRPASPRTYTSCLLFVCSICFLLCFDGENQPNTRQSALIRPSRMSCGLWTCSVPIQQLYATHAKRFSFTRPGSHGKVAYARRRFAQSAQYCPADGSLKNVSPRLSSRVQAASYLMPKPKITQPFKYALSPQNSLNLASELSDEC